eukprot:XP_014784069.1 PREDICTED: uncharacterized protein K02A2.6-like [Octopus bimaculoides]
MLKELDRCTKTKVKFHVKENAVPVFKPKRAVPFAVNEEFDRCEKLGVIEKIDYSESASPTVYVKKKKIRACADFSIGLNECLMTYSYSLLSLEEIFAKLNGGKSFSKLDLLEAYLQLQVKEECLKLLTINTHKGLYKFSRLPFGIKVAPSIFQQVMDTILADTDFAIAYLDDILIKSEFRDQHDKHVKKVFERLKAYKKE